MGAHLSGSGSVAVRTCPTRRRRRGAVLIGDTAVPCGGRIGLAGCDPAQREPAGPSFLLVMTDTHVRGRGAHSQPRRPGGTRRADRAYTSCPVCTPARAGIFTGMMPSATGAWANDMTGQHVPTVAAGGYGTAELNCFGRGSVRVLRGAGGLLPADLLGRLRTVTEPHARRRFADTSTSRYSALGRGAAGSGAGRVSPLYFGCRGASSPWSTRIRCSRS